LPAHRHRGGLHDARRACRDASGHRAARAGRSWLLQPDGSLRDEHRREGVVHHAAPDRPRCRPPRRHRRRRHRRAGAQPDDAATASALAASSNDELADAVARHEGRFEGLAAIAPQDPRAAGAELGRAVGGLGLKGVVINSHTKGECLDDPKFYEIFEAAESLSVPIYLHPVTPPKAMIDPFLARGLDGAVFGFAVETSLHALRLIFGGVLDRFPRSTIVLGHLGEALPFWLYRLDYMHEAIVRAGRYESVRRLERRVSDYLRESFYYTTSGMPWEPAISFTRSVVGADRVMYAMDYPYQFVPGEVAACDALPYGEEELRAFFESIAVRVFSLGEQHAAARLGARRPR
ncbi:MAG TPA: amidohydrolase family protein, partial [Acidimicrobiales bacterium]|nr:amidohydrolase family protein [Acidimicrobiales bacterium]